MHEEARLDEFTKDEWLLVCRRLRPNLSETEYDKMWADFQEMKRRKALQ